MPQPAWKAVPSKHDREITNSKVPWRRYTREHAEKYYWNCFYGKHCGIANAKLYQQARGYLDGSVEAHHEMPASRPFVKRQKKLVVMR
jgi:hypothetical protein